MSVINTVYISNCNFKMKIYHKLLLYKNKLLLPYLNFLFKLMAVFTTLASLLMLGAFVYQHGFPLDRLDLDKLNLAYRIIWLIFLIEVSVHLIFDYKRSKVKYKKIPWILSGLLYLTLIPVIFHQPEHHGAIRDFWLFLDDQTFRSLVLLVFALLNLSYGLTRMLGKRTNPSLILAVSFFVIIVIGAGLLLLPLSIQEGVKLEWIDALFTSTSAVCVTGLTTVNVATTFTPMGLTIIIILIQIGGVGVMTLTSFFALFFMGNTSIYNQLVVRDMVSSNSLNSLFSTLIYILGFTLVIEAMGMAAIWLSINGTMGMSLKEELAFAAFHSISAFCNAGFSTLPDNLGQPVLMTNHNWFFNIISVLIILGGIGFPILVNFKDVIKHHIQHWWNVIRTFKYKKYQRKHLYSLNTKIVLITTLFLLVFGTGMIALFEWNVSFAGMDAEDKLTQAFFNAVCPRTAGFSSVDLTALTLQSVLIYIFLMWVGGAAQSTAGGIKVNAFAAVFMNIISSIRGSSKVQVFDREISYDSIRRSSVTVILSLGVLAIGVFLITWWQPELHLLAVIFECVSALATVGSSLNTTPLLADNSKLLICTLMFIGRVGLITLMLGIVKQKKKMNFSYPKDNIIIN